MRIVGVPPHDPVTVVRLLGWGGGSGFPPPKPRPAERKRTHRTRSQESERARGARTRRADGGKRDRGTEIPAFPFWRVGAGPLEKPLPYTYPIKTRSGADKLPLPATGGCCGWGSDAWFFEGRSPGHVCVRGGAILDFSFSWPRTAKEWRWPCRECAWHEHVFVRCPIYIHTSHCTVTDVARIRVPRPKKAAVVVSAATSRRGTATAQRPGRRRRPWVAVQPARTRYRRGHPAAATRYSSAAAAPSCTPDFGPTLVAAVLTNSSAGGGSSTRRPRPAGARQRQMGLSLLNRIKGSSPRALPSSPPASPGLSRLHPPSSSARPSCPVIVRPQRRVRSPPPYLHRPWAPCRQRPSCPGSRRPASSARS